MSCNPPKISPEDFDALDCQYSPVLTHAESWKDAIPQRLINIIPESRKEMLQANEQLASLPEVAAFIMTRTLEAPMQSDWVDIYTYSVCTVCEKYWNESHWEGICDRRELTDYQNKQLLLPLRRFIYEQRRKVLKERIKSAAKRKEAA